MVFARESKDGGLSWSDFSFRNFIIYDVELLLRIHQIIFVSSLLMYTYLILCIFETQEWIYEELGFLLSFHPGYSSITSTIIETEEDEFIKFYMKY